MSRQRAAQFGTGHGHADGKLISLRSNPDVEFVGLYEPDLERRRLLEGTLGAYAGVRWLESASEVMEDRSITLVASEARNDQSLAQTAALVRAGKHVWYDKPAGDDWPLWQEVAAQVRNRGTLLQMGYMFRYHEGFRRIQDWVSAGVLGDVFSVRAHMSTSLDLAARAVIARHRGGIFYDLAGHMLDQVVTILGRPDKVTSFFGRHGAPVEGFDDNTLGVLEFPKALAIIDISAMEAPPMARRFEVYGSRGSAILEPFEPSGPIRLCLSQAAAGFDAGVNVVPVPQQSRQDLYDCELRDIVEVLSGRKPAERSLDHDTLVQETLLRFTQGIPS
ncbi:Gfo/Idh/MocA family oxidoreductase [uncultured Alsobacter sp.]|uniref:Gfo/Idh/MocA family protein n=1 Tax=uncultured Alsobacter sp. TaxID=1748258 RepID=UPI0025DF0E7A|nr:Gfo/Idh/MocA family oxidoreductase [uncultured Alsobacter sp.]